MGRVGALSQAYRLPAEGAWEGASLAKLLSAQPILYSKQVTVEGCEITLTPRAAQQFAMIIYATTNALKYGALSSPDGRVSISSKIDRHDGSASFVFSWKETGGPQVAPPRRGFGSVVLLEAAQQFGTVTMQRVICRRD